MTGELEVLDRSPRADPGGRVEPQGLVHGHVERRHLAEELFGARPPAGDRAALLGQALEPLGAAGQLVEEKGDGGGGGVVAGEEEGQNLVADLLVVLLVPKLRTSVLA